MALNGRPGNTVRPLAPPGDDLALQRARFRPWISPSWQVADDSRRATALDRPQCRLNAHGSGTGTGAEQLRVVRTPQPANSRLERAHGGPGTSQPPDAETPLLFPRPSSGETTPRAGGPQPHADRDPSRLNRRTSADGAPCRLTCRRDTRCRRRGTARGSLPILPATLKLHASKQMRLCGGVRPSAAQPLRSRPPAPACPGGPRETQNSPGHTARGRGRDAVDAVARARTRATAHAHHAVVVHGGYGIRRAVLLLPRFLLLRVSRVVRLSVGPVGPVGTVAGIRVPTTRPAPRASKGRPRGRGVRGRLLRRQCRRFRRHVPAAARRRLASTRS